MNMAAKLSAVKLFDEKMMLTYNVSERGQPKLTSAIIEYIKLQYFKFFHVNQMKTWMKSGLNMSRLLTKHQED